MLLKRIGVFFLDIIQVIVFAVAIFLFVYLLILQPHKIKGASMMPNFPDGEYLLTDKVTYRFQEPERGDVIVFQPPNSRSGEEFIKRIVGIPGDTIAIRENKVYIDNEELEESYIPEDVLTIGGAFVSGGKGIIVPTESYFVLGDNREHSSDSRSWGFVEKEKITGRAWLVYWPPSEAGVIRSPEY